MFKENTTISGLNRPRYIQIIIMALPADESCDVIPMLMPVVLAAEQLSSRRSKKVCGYGLDCSVKSKKNAEVTTTISITLTTVSAF